jgi:tripartite-type tricarboxylate transporter receptor subunit TctC
MKIVYPFPAGGAGDAVARIFADHLQKALGRPVIVENRTGAGGRIGVVAVKDAPADGSVLLFTATGQLAIQPHVISKAGYDPFSDLRPIAEIATSDLALAVSAELQIGSIDELVSWLRSNPDRATFASAGAGTSGYFAGTEFARARAVELRHVAYRGAAAAIPDVVAARVPVVVAITAELFPHHEAKGIRILATSGAERSSFVGEVPTFKEAGVDLAVPNGYSFFAPALTPHDVAERLEQEIAAASQSAEVQGKLSALKLKSAGLSAAALQRALREQYDMWRGIVERTGFKPE